MAAAEIEPRGPVKQREKRRPHVRWLILSAVLIFALLACAALVVVVVLYRSDVPWANVPLVMGVAAVAGVSLEVLLWTAAGVFGWGFLAKRREMLGRWRKRLFGGGKNETGQP